MKFLHYFDRWTKLSLIITSLAAMFVVGLLDYLTGSELSFAIFYLIPISLGAWYVDRRTGFVLSLVSAALWLIADLSAGQTYSQALMPYWNMSVRLGFFLIVTYTLSALKAAIQRQEDLGQFIVHDLRAPLANVITGLHQLDEMAPETTDATPKLLIALCLSSCSRMLMLVNSLLDLARLESGQMRLRLSEIEPAGVVDVSLQQVQLWAERNEIKLRAYIEAEIPAMRADPDVTVSILVNLLSNAIKFSPAGSTVQVNVVSVDAAGAVAISVSDQGQGIPEGAREKIFDKFSQLEAHRLKGSASTGLGLTFCRLAVEAQGGRIWLESTPNKGTTVTFTVPIKSSRPVGLKASGE